MYFLQLCRFPHVVKKVTFSLTILLNGDEPINTFFSKDWRA